MKAIRTAAAALTVVAAVSASLWTAGAASAHVTVAAPGVSVGATDASIVFRVPTESATASTVEVRVQLPTDTPLAGVLVVPVAGWTAKITNTKLRTPIKTDDGEITEVVSEIDWKADAAAAIKPGFVGEFGIIAGALPEDATTLTFKAIQTYSDKSQVAWIEVPAAGSTDEPEHPAPMLKLGPAVAATGAAATGAPSSAGPSSAGTATSPSTAAAASSAASKGAATTGIVLGAVGLVLGAAALALTLMRGRRSRTPTR